MRLRVEFEVFIPIFVCTGLEECGQVPVLSIVPYDEQTNVENSRLGALAADAIGDCDWAHLAEH